MTPEELGAILDEIGKRIGPAGEYVWTLTVRQIVLEGAVWAIAGGLMVVLCVVGFVVAMHHDPEESDSSAFAGMVALCFGIAGLILVSINALILLNPEYHAMTRLLDKLVPS